MRSGGRLGRRLPPRWLRPNDELEYFTGLKCRLCTSRMGSMRYYGTRRTPRAEILSRDTGENPLIGKGTVHVESKRRKKSTVTAELFSSKRLPSRIFF